MQIRIGYCLYGAATSIAAFCALASPAPAHGYKVLYAFCAQSNCADGSTPNSLIADSSGDLFGTVYQGGALNFGGVFELVRAHGSYKYKLLYSFCHQVNCTDGGHPEAGLILDKSGNLYGTVNTGGSQRNGNVFELVPGTKGWTLQILHDFCAGHDNCTDGAGPNSRLAYAGEQSGKLYDGKSPLFGTTSAGGNSNQGVAYQIVPNHFQVIWSFCAQQNCLDGQIPYATLVVDKSGDLYGTTLAGGSAGEGAAFEVAFANGGWNEKVLYSFCSLANCTDGAAPMGGLSLDSLGNLHGVTLEGGANCIPGQGIGCGVAYTIMPAQAQETLQHAFCAHTKCPDGADPQDTPTADSEENLYGITQYASDTKKDSSGGGTLYELSGSTLKVLHKFCAKAACVDGGEPRSSPVRDSEGRLFGTATIGGANNGGVVYQYEK